MSGHSEEVDGWVGFTLVMAIIAFVGGAALGLKFGYSFKANDEYRRGQCVEVCAPSKALQVMPDHACRCEATDVLAHPKSTEEP